MEFIGKRVWDPEFGAGTVIDFDCAKYLVQYDSDPWSIRVQRSITLLQDGIKVESWGE